MIDHILNDASHLERFRSLLTVLARRQMGARLRQKYDETDLVQETMLDAFRRRHQFRGHSDAEILGWLRKILYHNLLDVTQRFQTEKRDYQREISYLQETEETCRQCCLTDEGWAPEQQAEQREQIALLRVALRQLTPAQREAIELCYLQELSLKEVSIQMNRSVEAVSALIYRGLRRLRSIVEKQSEIRIVLVSANPSKKLADHHAGCR